MIRSSMILDLISKLEVSDAVNDVGTKLKHKNIVGAAKVEIGEELAKMR